MKTIHDWFSAYGESHQNKTNKLIHWICIPLIFWSIIGLLSVIPHSCLDVFNNSTLNKFMHWGTIVIVVGLLFYIRLSFKIFVGMLLFSSLVLIDIHYTVMLFDTHSYWGMFNGFSWMSGEDFLIYLSVFIFIFAWILQFIGHKIEGKKPSFFEDIQFLLIGPAWLLGFIYKKFKIKF